MKFNCLYIFGQFREEFKSEVPKKSCVVFLNKEVKIFHEQFSLINEFNNRQLFLRKKWILFQERVFKKIRPFLEKDEDYNYLLSNLFFESSPYKTDAMYNFFKIYLILNYIKRNKIKKIFLINVDKFIVDFFFKNQDILSISIEVKNIKNNFFNFKKLFKTSPFFSTIYYCLIEILKFNIKYNPKKIHKNKVALSYYTNNLEKNNFYDDYYGKVFKLLKNKFYIFYISNSKLSNFFKKNKIIFSNNSKGFLDSYFSIKNLKKVLVDFIKIRKKLLSIKTDNMFFFENINYLSLFKDDWLISNSSILFNNLIYEKKFINLLKKNPQIKEIIYLSEYQPWEQMLNKWAMKFNVKTKAITHAVIRSNMLQYCYPKIIHKYLYKPSFVGANSNLSKSIYIQNGFSKSQVIKIEAQRFNYLEKILYTKKQKKIEKIEKSILIITSVNFKETQELLETFALSKVKFTKLYIKEHPNLPVRLIIDSTIKKFPAYELLKGSLSDCLNLADIILTANGSSVLLEAVIKQKITISLISLSSLPMPAIKKASNLFFIYDAISLSKTLNKLFLDKQITIKSVNYNSLLYVGNTLKLWKKFLKK